MHNQNIGKVIGINGLNKSFEFELSLRDVKHIRRCLKLYLRIHPEMVLDGHDEELLQKFYKFGRRAGRSGDYQKRYKENHPDMNCVDCNTKENLTLDHIVPLRDGGTHAQSNLAPRCVNCHTIKNYSEMIEIKEREIQVYKKRIEKIKTSIHL